MTLPELYPLLNKQVWTPRDFGILHQVLGPQHIRVEVKKGYMENFAAEQISELPQPKTQKEAL